MALCLWHAMRAALVAWLVVASACVPHASAQAPGADSNANANITYITGTCKKTTPAFNVSNYYNQEAMLVKNLVGRDLSGSDWDLAKDNAFVGYNVYFCAVSPTQYPTWPPAGFVNLIEQKGFTVRQSCNMASELSYPAYHVFILFDRSGTYPTTPVPTISTADAQAIAAFYVRGGGIYGLTDNCPHIANVNKMFQSFPSVLKKMQMRYNNGINSPFSLYNGNPVGNNQFGHHDAFTGVAEMSSGHSVSVPYYDNQFGIGVFAPMCTVVINRVPIACASEAAPSFVYSHASMLYLDPPVQLVDVPDTCNWGRIILDTAWTRYGKEPTRLGSWRLAANAVAWLLNIERIFERSTSSQGAYAMLNCSKQASSGADDSDQSQVLGCSNGDALTLKSPTLMCNVGFAGGGGGDPPKCLALVVTETAGTTCVVDTADAKIGTYWIIVDGKNTSLQFSVTAASLTPRGTITAVTGTCIKTSATSLRACTDGSSMTIDWTLPYPRELTLGLGSTASVCRAFSVSGTQVHCIFKGLNSMPRGRYQTYINGVATGIPLTVETDIASLNKVLCSGSHSLSPQASSEVSETLTLLPTRTPTASASPSSSSSPSPTATATVTETKSLLTTVTLSQPSTATMTVTADMSLSGSHAVSRSTSLRVSQSAALPESRSLTASHRRSQSIRLTVTKSQLVTATMGVTESRMALSATESVAISASRTWQCVNATRLAAVFAPLTARSLSVRLQDVDIRNGTASLVVLAPLVGLAEAGLHVPWFQPWSVRAFVRVVSVPNQRGFVVHQGITAGIRLSFPKGLGSPSDVAGRAASVPAVIEIPALSDYRIFAAESVMLEVELSDLTLGILCGAAANASTKVPLVQLLVDVDEDALLASAQQVVTPIVAVMTAASPFAAPDLQALVMVAMMPCSNSYQKRTFAMFRALSVFTLDDTYDGVLWGNLIANVVGFGLHGAVVVVVSVVKGMPLAAAAATARFPSVYLQLVWTLTFASNAFASVQVLSDGDSGDSSRALAAMMLLGFCVAVPVAIMLYITRRVEAYYMLYEYSKWRREETALRVRLLSTFLLPVGRWEPSDVRRRLGPTITLQSRPEFYWPMLPLVSPILVALFSLVRNQSETVCLWVYVLLAALHVCLVLVIVFCKPLRSMVEDWFAAAAYVITTLYLLFSAINLAYPPTVAIEGLLGAMAVAQIVLLLVRLVYHVAHIFIARRLSEIVPSRLLFEWNHGRQRVEDDYASAGEEMRGLGKAAPGSQGHANLYGELEDLLNGYEDEHPIADETCFGGGTDEAEVHYLPMLNPIGTAAGSDGAHEGDGGGLLGGGPHRRSIEEDPLRMFDLQ